MPWSVEPSEGVGELSEPGVFCAGGVVLSGGVLSEGGEFGAPGLPGEVLSPLPGVGVISEGGVPGAGEPPVVGVGLDVLGVVELL